jgi:hypothetical protein
MKRIVLLVCGVLFLVANTAEARWLRRTNNRTYTTQSARVAPTTYRTSTAKPAKKVATASTSTSQPGPAATATTTTAQAAKVTTVSYSPSPAQPVKATAVSYSPSTAQGVANIMASRGQVGHFGGNPGYEGCGAGSSAAAAYNNCCYANSGMRTVDVGYARSSNGMWFCCRRYR